MCEKLFPLLKKVLPGQEHPAGLGPESDAAVLVPVFISPAGYEVLYTRRSEYVEHHPGEVSFPGGRYNAKVDRGLRDCALRETDEEIGVTPGSVEVLGALEPVRTISSSFVITPFVGVIPYPYRVTVNRAEVSEVFSVPLTALRSRPGWKREIWDFDGVKVPVEAFRWNGQVIWGATQRITRALLDLVDLVEGERDPKQK